MMLGLDVKDACLTVPQTIETKVSANLQGVERHFLLSRCLPGQRDGAELASAIHRPIAGTDRRRGLCGEPNRHLSAAKVRGHDSC